MVERIWLPKVCVVGVDKLGAAQGRRKLTDKEVSEKIRAKRGFDKSYCHY
jgi:hypothetical protein